MADITRLGEIAMPKLSDNMAPEDRRSINNYLMQLGPDDVHDAEPGRDELQRHHAGQAGGHGAEGGVTLSARNAPAV